MDKQLQTLNAKQRIAVWSERIENCRSSHMTVRAWCRENGLSEKTYYYWQHRVFALVTEQQPVFAEIVPGGVGDRSGVAVTVRIRGMEADIYNGADAATIGTVLRQLNYAE